jgi:hypothetical protein
LAAPGVGFLARFLGRASLGRFAGCNAPLVSFDGDLDDGETSLTTSFMHATAWSPPLDCDMPCAYLPRPRSTLDRPSVARRRKIALRSSAGAFSWVGRLPRCGRCSPVYQRAPHTPAPDRQEGPCPFWSPTTVIAASFGSSQGVSLSRSPHNSSHGPQQRGDLPPGLNRLGRIAAVLERVGVTLGSTRRLSAVQSTPAVRHRGRLALAPSPCPRSTSAAEVHRRFALHGVVPQVLCYPLLPPGPQPSHSWPNDMALRMLSNTNLLS